ncbi:hypothetical protein [Bradyrhizobium sp. STM 3809]|uniref:hypothetical protein n=1 Tax=Bradyrhizobium sp. STM 3809 TaxID=551936 RepID=UPI000554BC55|nr:hypothetical protein [Bradyrhizobium sp. STM 3809]
MLQPTTPIASHLACRDDRDTPLVPRRDNTQKHEFRNNETDKFSAEGLDRPNQLDGAWEISFCAQAVSLRPRTASLRLRANTQGDLLDGLSHMTIRIVATDDAVRS